MRASKALLLSNMLSSTESIEDAEIATFDASCVSTPDISVNIEPIQDLHGYANPWPAGGGENKFDVDKLVNTADITVSNGVITVTGNAKNSTKKLGELADLVVGETYTLTATTDGTDNLIYLYETGANTSWSFGNNLTVTQAHLDALVFFYGGNNTTSHISNMMIRLSSVTDASFAPYSNLCPISGRSEVRVTRTGKNLFDKSGTGYDSGYYLNSTGEKSASANWSIAYIPCKAGNRYSISGIVAGTTSAYFWWLNKEKQPISSIGQHILNPYIGITAPTESEYLGISYISNTENASYDGNTLMVELGSTATSYEPYQAQSVTLQLGQTVYGGTVDVTEGKLTITHSLYTFTGSEQWSKQSGKEKYYSTAYILRGIAKLPEDNFKSVKIVTSIGIFDYAYNSLETHPYSMCVAGDGRIGIHETLYNSSGDTLKDVQLCYELATPLTFQLIPQQIQTLVGENNVWSDSGNISVHNITCNADFLDLFLKLKLIGDC